MAADCRLSENEAVGIRLIDSVTSPPTEIRDILLGLDRRYRRAKADADLAEGATLFHLTPDIALYNPQGET
jgi:hypothetical protein